MDRTSQVVEEFVRFAKKFNVRSGLDQISSGCLEIPLWLPSSLFFLPSLSQQFHAHFQFSCLSSAGFDRTVCVPKSVIRELDVQFCAS